MAEIEALKAAAPRDYLVRFSDGFKIPMSWVTAYEFVDQDYDVDPDRTISGRLFRNRVAMIPEVSVSIRPLTQEQMSQLITRLSKEEFTVEFYNTTIGSYSTAEFYCGPSSRKVKIKRTINGIMYNPFTFTLTGIHNAR